MPSFHNATSSWEELPNMERNAQEELKAHLMVTNEEFRRLASQHTEFAQKLDALESLPHLTYEEELEETRLKKLKLRDTGTGAAVDTTTGTETEEATTDA